MIPAATTLDRSQALLVVIDVQERLAAVMSRRARVLSRCALMMRAARIVGMPIVVTRQYPQGLGEIDPAVAAVLEQTGDAGAATIVDKVDFDCFGEPAFTDAVCRTGRRQVLIAGMETHICVTQTALTAVAEGFDVHVAGDACCSRDDECHSLALARLGHAGVAVTTAESSAYELVGRAGTEEFRALLSAVKLSG